MTNLICSADWSLFVYSLSGALFVNMAIHGNRLILPRITRGGFELGTLSTIISAFVTCGLFVPHNPQTAIMSAFALEDMYFLFVLRARAGLLSQVEYTPRVLPIESDEKIEELREDFEYMNPEGDEI